MFEYEAEGESCLRLQEYQFKANFFLPLIDYAICCLKDRFEQMHGVGAIFSFFTSTKILCESTSITVFLVRVKIFYITVNPLEMNDDLERFAVILRKTKKTSKQPMSF